MNYKVRIKSCNACKYNNSLEHELYHQTGLSECIIRELKLISIEEIEESFASSTLISPCYISLSKRKTKFKETNRYLFPKKLIDLIKLQ